MKPIYPCKSSSRLLLRKGIALSTVLFFAFLQAGVPVYAGSTTDEIVLPDILAPARPDILLNAPVVPAGDYHPRALSYGTVDFLSASPLTAVTRRSETGGLADAIAEFSPDYAGAAVVDSLSAEDIESLSRLSYEVGIAVIEKNIVLFTSGNAGEIRVRAEVKELLDGASLVAHTHSGEVSGMPSPDDIRAASGVEYVVSTDGVYAYDKNGLIGSSALDYGYLAVAVDEASEPDASSLSARRALNRFIAAMDDLNRDAGESVVFRTGGITVFPNSPGLASFASEQPAANLAMSRHADPLEQGPEFSVIRLDYQLEPGSYGGAVLNFADNPADLSGTSRIAFDVRTDNQTVSSCPDGATQNCMKVEIKDMAWRTAVLFVPAIQDEFTRVTLEASNILAVRPDLDLTQIREIVFVVEEFRTAGKPDGFLEIRVGGLPPLAGPVLPDLSLGAGDMTPLPVLAGGQNPPFYAFAGGGVAEAAMNVAGPTEALLHFEHLGEGTYGGLVADYGNGTIDFSNAFPGGLVVGIGSPQLESVFFEIKDADGNAHKVKLEEVSETTHYYRLNEAMFPGVDMNRIKGLGFVVEYQNIAEPETEGGVYEISQSAVASESAAYRHLTGCFWHAFRCYRVDEEAYYASSDNKVGRWRTPWPYDGDYKHESRALFEVDLASWLEQGIAAGDIEKIELVSTVTSNAANPAAHDFTLHAMTEREDGSFPDPEADFKGAVSLIAGFNDYTASSTPQTFTADVTQAVLADLAAGRTWSGFMIRPGGTEGDVLPVLTFEGTFLKITHTGSTVLPRPESVDVHLNWGPFGFDGSLLPDDTRLENDVSSLPLTAAGRRVPLNVFAGPGADTQITRHNTKFATLHYESSDPNAFGGAYLHYDDYGTPGVESIDFNASFPEGFIVQLDSPDTTGITFEMTDADGRRETVELGGITTWGQRWVISADAFTELDLSRIVTLTFVFKGMGPQTIVLRTENYDGPVVYYPDTSLGASDITPLPALSDGGIVPIGDFAGAGASHTMSETNESASLHYDGNGQADAYGGMFISYGWFGQSINYEQVFSEGLVVKLGTTDTGSSSVRFELTDVTGRRDTITLSAIAGTENYYRIPASAFLGIDMTRITTMSFVFVGGQEQYLDVTWGPWARY